MSERLLKRGDGWRLGWDPSAPCYPGLVGGDDWATELTAAELADFCHLTREVEQAMARIATELMAEERVACTAASDRLWLEAEGLPAAYDLHLIVQGDRQVEGSWQAAAVPGLLQATQRLQVF
ncbi:MAG: DUF1818 family protein [Spirulinaceae cyanobacterium RM2_2_10]|nr:DUF1818 family protein [Spirulinaceae cyanobacterium SM2_1_0]NJO20425.1 DUF1818 family protein [Spirulinaceae cyanobacterium RM2_2_10]